MGYYSLTLDANVAIYPDRLHLLGTAIPPDHPAREMYVTGSSQKGVYEVMRGKVTRYGALVRYNNEPLGHLCVNMPYAVYFTDYLTRIQGMLGVLSIAVLAAIGLVWRVSSHLHRGVQALLSYVELSPNNPESLPSMPSDFEPVITSFAAMRQEIDQLHQCQLTMARAAALGELVGVVAHEVRNPLTVITASVAMAEKEGPGSPFDRHLGRISQAAEKIESFLKKLSPLSRLPAHENYRQVPVDKLVLDVLSLMEPLLEAKELYHATELGSNLGVVSCDEAAVGQALMNLLMNAMEATPPGGVVSIRACQDKEGIHIAVTDSGCGIPEAIRDSVFQRFVSTKRGWCGTLRGAECGNPTWGPSMVRDDDWRGYYVPHSPTSRRLDHTWNANLGRANSPP